MTNGYKWHHLVKIIPTDGAEKVLDLRVEFPDTRGPISTRLTYSQEEETRADLNRVLRQDSFGYRADVSLVFDVFNMQHQRALTDIMAAFHDQDVAVQLSLDGGFKYREMVLTRAASPRPIRGLTVVGATFEIRMRAAELDDTVIPVADSW